MKKVKWGILSTGWIASKFAAALQTVENSELHAVGSRTIESAEKFGSEFGVKKAYGCYNDLYIDPEIDVIYIATPHNLHYQNTIDCLKNGKNVLCEKPFAINGNEVRNMIAKAKEKNLFLMEALWSRFLPNIIKVKELIDEGAIGKVKLISASFTLNSKFNPTHRHYNRELGGGTLLDIGIYNVFLSLFLLGKPKEIISAAGIGPTGVDHNLSVTFKYDNELLSVMYSSFVASTPTVAEIHGESGKIFLDHLYFCPGNVKLIHKSGEEKVYSYDFKSNGYDYEAEEVANCILRGKKESDIFSLDDSLLLIDTLDLIRKQTGIIYPGHDEINLS